MFFQSTFNGHMVSVIYPTIDILFFNIGNFMCEQLKVIQKGFTRINSEIDRKRSIGKSSETNISLIVEKHIEILNFCKDFSGLFRPLIAFKFFSIAIGICVSGFQIMVVCLPFRFSDIDSLNAIFFLVQGAP